LGPVKKITNLIKSDVETHIWNFSSVGGVNRVNLLSGDDIKSLDQLDQKLWTALSCPVYGMEIDSKTLALIDSDGDNRIRVPEIIAAAKWITSLLKNPDDLFDPFKKKKNPWPAIIISVILVAAAVYLLWYFDILTKWGIM